MDQTHHTTQLIGSKDKNITLNKALMNETYIELLATLDYTPPKCRHCKGKQIKYDFQKPSKIPFIEMNRTSKVRQKIQRLGCGLLTDGYDYLAKAPIGSQGASTCGSAS